MRPGSTPKNRRASSIGQRLAAGDPEPELRQLVAEVGHRSEEALQQRGHDEDAGDLLRAVGDRRGAAGRGTTSSGTTTSGTPATSGPKVSATESTKLIGARAAHDRRRARRGGTRSAHARRLTTPRWVPITAFGRPVLPEVKISVATPSTGPVDDRPGVDGRAAMRRASAWSSIRTTGRRGRSRSAQQRRGHERSRPRRRRA